MKNSTKILIVDDESSIRCLLSDVLSGEGFDVTEAKDGQESLEMMAHTTFDLVITDVNMPRMDGLAMLGQMNKFGRGEKVILMTGNLDDERFSGKEMSRVVSHLPKPFRIDYLLDIVCAVTNNN